MHPTWLRPRNPMSFLSSMAESSSTMEVVKRRAYKPLYVETECEDSERKWTSETDAMSQIDCLVKRRSELRP